MVGSNTVSGPNMAKVNKEFVQDMTDKLRVIQSRLRRHDYTDDDLAVLETFLAVALRVIARSNPSKIDDAVRTVETCYLIKRVPHGQT